MGAHALGTASYAVRAASLEDPSRPEAVEDEIRWRLEHMSAGVRDPTRRPVLCDPPGSRRHDGQVGPAAQAARSIEGLGLRIAAQESAIRAACRTRGLELLRIHQDVASGGGLVVVDLGTDTMTTPGELVANITASPSRSTSDG